MVKAAIPQAGLDVFMPLSYNRMKYAVGERLP